MREISLLQHHIGHIGAKIVANAVQDKVLYQRQAQPYIPTHNNLITAMHPISERDIQ